MDQHADLPQAIRNRRRLRHLASTAAALALVAVTVLGAAGAAGGSGHPEAGIRWRMGTHHGIVS